MTPVPEVISRFEYAYDFLSNFDICFTFNKSVEHLFQAGKALYGADAKRIYSARTPGQAKKLGRAKDLVMVPNWDQIKNDHMLNLLRRKFNQTRYRDLLLETGNAELIEGNLWHDNYWGACQCHNCVDKVKHNWLGRLLMQVRGELRGRIITERELLEAHKHSIQAKLDALPGGYDFELPNR